MPKRPHVGIIGAGAGGLGAALALSKNGFQVTVVERAAEPGGKMREVDVSGVGVAAGPTVFTMRWIFDGLLDGTGRRLEDVLDLYKADCLARHSWPDRSQLDLFADIDRSAAAIADFAGKDEAQNYLDFCAEGAKVFETLRDTFIAAQKPGPLGLAARVGLFNPGKLLRTRPFQTYWSALGSYFRDPRLRQLFGRYATYVGSSPLQAPATLMLIAHVEQDGVWLVDGGMRAVAGALADLAIQHGAAFRFGADVAEIETEGRRASAIRLLDGERIPVDAVIFNGDVNALASGLLGKGTKRAAPATRPDQRSLSALTWCLHATASGFDLEYHNVFFEENYPSEFKAVFENRKIPESPTIYICAQDRLPGRRPDGPERLLLLVNAPPDGDRHALSESTRSAVLRQVMAQLSQAGLQLSLESPAMATDPTGFHALFPATGGALYGRANHGPMESFARAGARSRIRGLYLAGGSVHPGAGVPMAVMSGRLAADAVMQDFGSV